MHFAHPKSHITLHSSSFFLNLEKCVVFVRFFERHNSGLLKKAAVLNAENFSSLCRYSVKRKFKTLHFECVEVHT